MSQPPLEPPAGFPPVLGTASWRHQSDHPLDDGVAIEGGRLVLRGRGPSMMTGRALTTEPVRDVIVDTVLRASGTGPDEGFGVVVRQSSPERYLAWRMTNSRVILVSLMDGTETPVAAGTLAPDMEMNTEPDAPNRFTVVACGPAVTLILNSMVVTSVIVGHRYADGHAGVAIEQRHPDGEPRLAVEWFQVRSILPDES